MAEPQANGPTEPLDRKPELPPIKVDGNYTGVPNVKSPDGISGKPNSNPFDEIIPHANEVHHRNLILCFDGTGDQFDADVNICRLITAAIS
jgi:hypothetical protein